MKTKRAVESGLVFCKFCMAAVEVSFDLVMNQGTRVSDRRIEYTCPNCKKAGFAFELSEETARAFPRTNPTTEGTNP